MPKVDAPGHDPARSGAIAQQRVQEGRDLRDDSTEVASIRDVAGTIAHDLNNLLAIVLGYSELLAANEQLSPPVRSSILEITKAAKGGRNLVERLRALGRGESSAPGGSTVPTTTPQHPGKPGGTPPIERTSRHILYLDDDAPVVKLVCRGLAELGHRVSGFVSTQDALVALEANADAFDLVVTDYSMPLVSGLDVAKRVALLRPELRVVLTSGAVSDELRDACSRLGVCELVEKSVSIQELCATIDAMLTDSDRT